MRRRRISGGPSVAMVPALMCLAFALFSGGGAAAAAARTSDDKRRGPSPWTVLPKAETLQLDPARQYAGLIVVPGIASMAVSAGDMKDKLDGTGTWAQIEVWDDPADLPEPMRQAFAAEDLKPRPGAFWFFGRPKVRSSMKTSGDMWQLQRAHARQARQFDPNKPVGIDPDWNAYQD